MVPVQPVGELEDVLPEGTQVRTGRAQAAEDASETNEFITFLQGFLLAFAGIALFVGSFVIANSLSITIAQRAREFATVRTLGASAFGARRIVAHANTKALIDERGAEDWASEQGRMPRLFAGAETIPGLTRPTDPACGNNSHYNRNILHMVTALAPFIEQSLGPQATDLAQVNVDTLQTRYSVGFKAWQMRVILLRPVGTKSSSR